MMRYSDSFRFRSINFIGVFFGFFWLGVFIVLADTHYVTPPGGYGTNNPPYTNWADAATNIQWAVDVAVNGDTVLITNGNYTPTNQIYIGSGKDNLTLSSVNGRDATFINGNWPNTTNRCIGIFVVNITINGFTVTNGYAKGTDDTYPTNNGGGIFANNSGATILNCTIKSNMCKRYGGGISMYDGLISNCIIEKNKSVDYGEGGGIAPMSGSLPLTIANCLISQNRGNGIVVIGAGPCTVRNCVIIHNYGAVRNGDGAGITCEKNTTVENCTIVSNYQTSSIQTNGGGIGTRSGGSSTNIQIRNCIIYSNYAFNAASVNWCTNSMLTNVIFSHNCTTPTNGMQGSGNITNWPMFVDYSATNYRLAANSPGINTGTNMSWMTNAYDLDGRTRIRYGTVDMGAYETIYEGTFFTIP